MRTKDGNHVVDEVPDEGGRPENEDVGAADELGVLGLDRPLFDEEDDEAGHEEGHAQHAERREVTDVGCVRHIVVHSILLDNIIYRT